MTDVFTKEKRSEIMSNIKSKWTRQEIAIHNLLKSKKIKHKMHPRIAGNPDIILPDKKIAVFLHGCFWHKCPLHYVEPKTKRKYWIPKINHNVEKDRKNSRILRKNGWKVVIIWEHEVKKNASSAIKKIVSVK